MTNTRGENGGTSSRLKRGARTSLPSRTQLELASTGHRSTGISREEVHVRDEWRQEPSSCWPPTREQYLPGVPEIVPSAHNKAEQTASATRQVQPPHRRSRTRWTSLAPGTCSLCRLTAMRQPNRPPERRAASDIDELLRLYQPCSGFYAILCFTSTDNHFRQQSINRLQQLAFDSCLRMCVWFLLTGIAAQETSSSPIHNFVLLGLKLDAKKPL
ncbi:hypothetical protein Enr17x_04090 [Gimesia fumaroli]|uniref:Uncharacterized protein n=1 Tax=Gimesia fumaroli TaxID=2527976 RepID=A0A518I5P0_9PLAN|nr:hypothetical protein Enr17x_04090 [Gimesia fumaroli]